MPFFAPFTLQCERVHLRFLHAGDTAALFRIFSDPEAMRYWSSAAWTDPARAGALLTRLGFRHEGRLRERWFVNGEVCDSDYYGPLRPDWQAR